MVGAGTMGRGIAQVAARAGYEVLLHDIDEARVEGGLSGVRDGLAKGVARGKLSEREREEALARLRGTTDLDRSAVQSDLVIEAVPEELDLKLETFRRLDAAASDGTILATNTSSLSVSRIAEATKRPGLVVGMHFFNPVPAMPLVEIVRGSTTSPGVIEAVRATAVRMGKETIVVRDSPGFATSRLGVALGLEAMRMLEEGVASAADIDRAMELGYGHPMGPLRLTDLVGLDVRLAIAEHLSRELGGERFRPPDILRRMVAEGKLGKKTGEGFYRWD